VQSLILTIDRLSTAVGQAFAWYIVILTFGESYEVFVRYALDAPTTWAYDVSYNMYGALFFMAGAYCIARNAHVRADVVYRLLRPRLQASIDLVLYLAFFFPGVIALIYAGWDYARYSWSINEHSNVTANGPPVYQFKSVIPVAGVLVMIQPLAEIARCVVCLRTGRWPERLKDAEEIDVVEEQLAHSEFVDDESRRTAIEQAHRIDEAAHQRGGLEKT